MVADTLWLPGSTCGERCFDENPQVSTGRAVVRVAAAASVLTAAVAVAPLVAALPDRLRAPVLRTFARTLLAAFGIRHDRRGRAPRAGELLVANHVSWVDVLVMMAHTPSRLLAKHDVATWPVIGRLARATGALFVDRTRPRALPDTVAAIVAALRAGQVVAVFPEGTTWCGRNMAGRFRPAMFQAAVDAGAPIAPVTLKYRTADGTATAVAAYIGEDTLVASIRRVVFARGLRVTVQGHPALHPMPEASRRSLARTAQAVIQPAAPAAPAPVHTLPVPVPPDPLDLPLAA